MILVTGATGNIGRELVHQLAVRKQAFRVMVRTREARAAFLAKGIQPVHGDFEDPGTFGKALTGIDTVFLLTPPRPDGVELEWQFLEACQERDVRHVLRVSAVAANPWAASALLRHHGRCEAQLEDSGLAWTHLRPALFMQNLAAMFGPSVAEESTLFAPMGAALVPWIDSRDVAAVAAAILTSKGHEGLVYELTGPQALSFTQVAEEISIQLARRIAYVDVPDGAAHQAMLRMGASHWLAEGMLSLYHLVKANGATAQVLGTVERLTGRPSRTLAAYLLEFEAAFQTRTPAEAFG
jgi:uncharacterized protein YbjT (DUF2867 family)